ncbi:hypothetical protein K431DRAFT_265929 [Polychaeton citri CBS 116435]|uniref:Hydantoin racemase n=1 Tax=Polychaeton citri CBS 116435 TaxID=1314669 RepID=A0A9P4QBA8_9PEZI|nr:hypothetical protein K431DRAFT_265929 [Polychaeton citri CBS 116435]
MEIRKKRKIIVCNPNTSTSMTDALKPLVDALGFDTTLFEYFTAPSGVSSINNEDDAAVSAEACLPDLKSKLHEVDGFLICCYSQHPLVHQLRRELAERNLTGKAVTGIFEASVATCIQSINPHDRFGIVSTGKQWEEILAEAVTELLGSEAPNRYAGTETTGLNADELHSTPAHEVNKRMKAATKRLLGKEAKAICLGCAGMAGMDVTVREACIEQLGKAEGERIKIIDGVVSGTCFLEGALRAGL